MPKASKPVNAIEPVVKQAGDESPEVKAPSIEIPQSITIRELASLLHVEAIQVIKQLMRNSIMANINQAIAYEAAAAVVTEYGYEAHLKPQRIHRSANAIAKIKKLEGEEQSGGAVAAVSMGAVIFQIMILDIVFSLDSVITAVGMAKEMSVMITAVVISVGVMLAFAGRISRFIEQHPTMKMLALSFLILIGVMLIAEGAGQHVEKGYIYFAMAFSLAVEMMNMTLRRRRPVHLKQTYVDRKDYADATGRTGGEDAQEIGIG